MSKITLTNFIKMTPEIPEGTSKNQHYQISGVDPLSYLSAPPSAQEKKYAPLRASRTFNTQQTFAAPIANIVPANSSLYDIIIVLTNGHCYAYGFVSGLIDLSTNSPFSGATGSSMNVFNENIFLTLNSNGSLNYKALNTTPSVWSNYAFTASVVVPRPLENFLDFMVFPDALVTNGVLRIIKSIDSSSVITTKFDLGTGFNVVGLQNYNNRYLVIAASQTVDATITSPSTYSQNTKNYYLFLWDGKSYRYNVAIKVPGQIIDIRSIGDQCFLIVNEQSGIHALYRINGNVLKRLFPLAIDRAKGASNGNKFGTSLFEYEGKVGINLNTKGQLIYREDSEKFILTQTDLDMVVGTGQIISMYASSGANLQSYGQSAGISSISYVSQWLDFDNLSSIIVRYSTPPQEIGDTIQIILDGDDGDGVATTNLSLNTITSSNYYNPYHTQLDCKGFRGKQVRVTLTTTSAGTWTPDIQEIELNN